MKTEAKNCPTCGKPMGEDCEMPEKGVKSERKETHYQEMMRKIKDRERKRKNPNI